MKWGILGVGRAGRARVDALRQLGEEVVIGYRGRFLEPLGVTSAGSEAEVLALAEVVVVSSPSAEHAGQVRRALEAGCHVVVDYPLASSAEEARALFALAKERGLALHVEHIERISPATRALSYAAQAEGVQAGMVLVTRDVPYASAAEHALALVPRLHRADEVFGGIDQITVIDCRDIIAQAVLHMRDGSRVLVDSRAWAGLTSRHRLVVVTLAGATYEIEGRVFKRNGEVIEVQPAPLFVADTQFALAWIKEYRYGPHPLEEAIIRIFSLTDAMAQYEKLRRQAGVDAPWT